MYSTRKRSKYIFSRPKKRYFVIKAAAALIALLLICLIAMFIYVNLFGINSKVHLTASLPTAEINSEVMASSFIESIDDGGTVAEDALVDTSALGTTECVLIISINGREKEYYMDVQIQDTTAPVIQCSSTVNVLVGSNPDMTSIASATDNSNEEVTPQLSGSYSTDEVGSFDLTFTASDPSGNEAAVDFTLNVIDAADYEQISDSLKDEDGNITFMTDNGYQGTIDSDGVVSVEDIIIVSSSTPLPSTYGSGIDADALNAFTEMRSAAAADNVSIYLMYAFRSYSQQSYRYSNMVRYYGEEAASIYCAEAGCSEHQTGLAFDVNTSNDRASDELASQFVETDAGAWLIENCYKYGFIIRYPEGKEAVTGYAYAPWHIRYVGTDLAEQLYNDGDWITLEEYFGLPYAG